MNWVVLLECGTVLLIRVSCIKARPFRTRTIRGGNSVKYVEVHLPIQLGPL